MFLTQSSSHILFISPTVISGEEYAQPYVADVLISGGRIARIAQPGTLSDQLGAEVRKVEARGYVLCPGFIDLHAHSDLYLLTHPDHEAKISQGCTVSYHHSSVMTQLSMSRLKGRADVSM